MILVRPEVLSLQKRIRYLGGLMFLILLNTNLLRSIKDSVVPLRLGAEAISFVRIYFELPFLGVCVVIYRICMKRFSQLFLFRCLCGFYAASIILWTIYTQYAALSSPNMLLTPLARCFADFPYAFLYILFDLWPLMAYTNFYWELSNRIFSSQEAKIAYPRFTLMGQSNLFVAGILIILCALSADAPFLCPVRDPPFMALIAVVNCGFLERMYTRLSPAARIVPADPSGTAPSLYQVWKEPLFFHIFISLIAYTSAICVIEIMCLHHLRKMFFKTQQLLLIQGFSILGLGCMMSLLSLWGRRILALFPLSWALDILPISLFICGMSAFLSLFIKAPPPVIVCLFISTFVGARALKYALYDPAKEIATMERPEDVKRVGRIVDMTGIGLGRFLAHLFPVILLQCLPAQTYDTLFPLMAGYFTLFVLILWISTRRMGRAFAS